jgi:hypothetical protein
MADHLGCLSILLLSLFFISSILLLISTVLYSLGLAADSLLCRGFVGMFCW